uniref:Uncharacterized protein n=1 Tax=Sparus aurata TaxID=8175 RepID=A0A671XNE8_SPAAU
WMEWLITVVIRGLMIEMFVFTRAVGKGSRAQVEGPLVFTVGLFMYREFRGLRLGCSKACPAVFIFCSSPVNEGVEREKLTVLVLTGAWRSRMLSRVLL